MIELYKQSLRAARCPVRVSYDSAYASEPTLRAFAANRSGSGFVGGLISFKEKNGLWRIHRKDVSEAR
jgi:hypothetical protein